jgi:hypothetical protein
MKTAHRSIKRFSMDGRIISSTAFARMQQIYSEVLEEQMREAGYVPRLDLMPEWTTSYQKSYYEFEISIYGTYVGRKKAKCLEGVEGGKPVYFHQNRPKESSLPQAAPYQEK